MLRCETELMEECRLASKMRRTSVLSIHTNLRNGRQANRLGRGQKLWYEKTINRIINKKQLFLFGDAHEYKLDERVMSNKEYFKNMQKTLSIRLIFIIFIDLNGYMIFNFDDNKPHVKRGNLVNLYFATSHVFLRQILFKWNQA